jgi:hypothetical protein
MAYPNSVKPLVSVEFPNTHRKRIVTEEINGQSDPVLDVSRKRASEIL